jgi:hypothetical protein
MLFLFLPHLRIAKQLKRQRHRKQGAPGVKVYSTESIKTEGEENETEGVVYKGVRHCIPQNYDSRYKGRGWQYTGGHFKED